MTTCLPVIDLQPSFALRPCFQTVGLADCLAALRDPDVRPLIDEVQQRLGTVPGRAGLLAALRDRLAGGWAR